MISDTQDSVSTVQTVESPGAYLTLTRTATQALTTAGTNITWQSAIRSQGISWSGTDITIPTAGYYAIYGSFAVSIATNTYIRILLNSANSLISYAVPYSTGGGFAMTISTGLYLQDNDIVRVNLTPAANCTLNQNGEGFAAPSPMLHIIQLSGVL